MKYFNSPVGVIC